MVFDLETGFNYFSAAKLALATFRQACACRQAASLPLPAYRQIAAAGRWTAAAGRWIAAAGRWIAASFQLPQLAAVGFRL